VQAHPDFWVSRCLDFFHNRERLLEIAFGPPARIRRPHRARRIYVEAATGPEIHRAVFATDGTLNIDRLELIAFLLGHDDLPLQRENPLTQETQVRRFNFAPSTRFNRAVEIYNAGPQFIAANPEDWRSYVLSAADNYHDLVHKVLPKLDLQRLQHRRMMTVEGPVRVTQFAKPIKPEEITARATAESRIGR
ncbi:MAG: hypothetical protein ACREB3_07920, partial [Burkholderiales bacterium]